MINQDRAELDVGIASDVEAECREGACQLIPDKPMETEVP